MLMSKGIFCFSYWQHLSFAFRCSDQKRYSILIDNLRMATKYSFHVKASGKAGEQKATGRADFSGNELNSDLFGERIVMPTKGCNAK